MMQLVDKQAANKYDSVANRLQCFMISSVCSSNKYIIGYISVKNMHSDYLTTNTKQVIKMYVNLDLI